MKQFIKYFMLICILFVHQHNLSAQSIQLGEQGSSFNHEELYRDPSTMGRPVEIEIMQPVEENVYVLYVNYDPNATVTHDKSTFVKSSKNNKSTKVTKAKTEQPAITKAKETSEVKAETVAANTEKPLKVKTETTVAANTEKPIVAKAEKTVAPVVRKEVTAQREPVIRQNTNNVQSKSSNLQTRKYTKFIGTEVVGKDSRLTWVAYKYYGNKDLWVFIYEANRDVIKHPNLVKPGQKLRIPALDAQYTDLTNPELRKLLDELSAKYL
jgi:hypothetical protein